MSSPMTQNCLCLCCNQSIDPSRAAGFVTGGAKCLWEASRNECSMNETPTKAAWEASRNECSMNETPTKAA